MHDAKCVFMLRLFGLGARQATPADSLCEENQINP